MSNPFSPLRLGDVEVRVLSDGAFRLDGGTMFGIVPKAIWSRLAPPDEQNRIELGLNSLLIRSPRKITLLEAGIGRAFSPKQMDIYRLDSKTNLLLDLERQGVRPEDVDRVILTHLHFDHSGWCTRETDGRWSPTFPKARYFVQAAEWEDAFEPNELTQGGYLAGRLAPLKERGCLELVEGEADLGDGIVLIPTPSHVRGHQAVRISGGGVTVFCPGDVIPTRHHLRLPYIMGYDLDPQAVVRVKSSIIKDAVAGQWIIFFIHDHKVPLARLSTNSDGGIVVTPLS